MHVVHHCVQGQHRLSTQPWILWRSPLRPQAFGLARTVSHKISAITFGFYLFLVTFLHHRKVHTFVLGATLLSTKYKLIGVGAESLSNCQHRVQKNMGQEGSGGHQIGRGGHKEGQKRG